MGPPSYMRHVVDRNVVIRHMTVHYYSLIGPEYNMFLQFEFLLALVNVCNGNTIYILKQNFCLHGHYCKYTLSYIISSVLLYSV